MKVVFALLCAAALVIGAWLFGRPPGVPSFASGEWLLAAIAVAAALARWRFVSRRRQRQKLEQLRDSALW